MASDVFQRTVSNFGGSFAADSARLNFAGVGNAGLLVQSLQFQYTQAITRLFEVGERSVYYVGGRTQGGASLSRVVGPRTLLSTFYEIYGDVCNARSNIITFSVTNQCENATRAHYTLKFCVLTTIGVTVAAADMVIGETSQLMFSSLEFDQ